MLRLTSLEQAFWRNTHCSELLAQLIDLALRYGFFAVAERNLRRGKREQIKVGDVDVLLGMVMLKMERPRDAVMHLQRSYREGRFFLVEHYEALARLMVPVDTAIARNIANEGSSKFESEELSRIRLACAT